MTSLNAHLLEGSQQVGVEVDGQPVGLVEMREGACQTLRLRQLKPRAVNRADGLVVLTNEAPIHWKRFPTGLKLTLTGSKKSPAGRGKTQVSWVKVADLA